MTAVMKKKVLVFATWGKNPWEWGSGFRVLCEKFAHDSALEIIGVLSNYPAWGVYDKAKALWIPFEYVQINNHTWSHALLYQKLVETYTPDIIALSGYLKQITGIDRTKCINIHPWPLTSAYAWPGKYGHHVHDAIRADYQAGKIKRTCVSMHFVNPNEYDDPRLLFFQYPVELEWCTSAEEIAKKVNAVEHERQWRITRMVTLGEIRVEEIAEDASFKIHFPEWYAWSKVIDLHH